jgi:SAC3 family protein LENG8/THP3
MIRKQKSSPSKNKKQVLGLDHQESQPDDWEQMTIKGFCQDLEKSYFRLTSAPDPQEVRPEEVLWKSLKLISKKWKKQEADYRYIDE